MTFPTLNSGAVSQYPALKVRRFKNMAVRFVDGREQRCRQSGAMARAWMVRLESLTGDELVRVTEFLKMLGGRNGAFIFTDPFDGVTHENCYLSEDTCQWTVSDHDKGMTVVWIYKSGG